MFLSFGARPRWISTSICWPRPKHRPWDPTFPCRSCQGEALWATCCRRQPWGHGDGSYETNGTRVAEMFWNTEKSDTYMLSIVKLWTDVCVYIYVCVWACVVCVWRIRHIWMCVCVHVGRYVRDLHAVNAFVMFCLETWNVDSGLFLIGCFLCWKRQIQAKRSWKCRTTPVGS